MKLEGAVDEAPVATLVAQRLGWGLWVLGFAFLVLILSLIHI